MAEDEADGLTAEVPREFGDATGVFSPQTIAFLQNAAEKARDTHRINWIDHRFAFQIAKAHGIKKNKHDG